MSADAKRCSGCGETKPLDQYYLRSSSDPFGPRRSRCKSCERAYRDSYKLNGPSLKHRISKEIIEHGSGNPEALSSEVREAVFTDTPLDLEAVAAFKKRCTADKARRKRLEACRDQRWGCAA